VDCLVAKTIFYLMFRRGFTRNAKLGTSELFFKNL